MADIVQGELLNVPMRDQHAIINLRDAASGTFSGVFYIDKSTDATASIVHTEKVQLTSHGTAAASLGARKSWYIENGSGNFPEMARMDVEVVTATDAAEDARFDIYTVAAGTVTRHMRLSPAGHVISIPDNVAAALDITQGANSYIKCVSTDSGEKVVFGKAVEFGSTASFSAASSISLLDDSATAFQFLEGANVYGTFVTTNNAEAINWTKRMTTTDGVASGTARVIGGLAYTNTAASTAITNTTAETAFSTQYSIPADTLKAGSLVKIRFQGIATATNGSDTLTIKLWLATSVVADAITGITLVSMAATDVANDNVFQGEYELIVRTIGAGGTVIGAGTFKSIPAAEGTMTIKDDILASTALNTTVAQIVAVTADWSAADPGNSVRLDFLRVEIY